MGIFAMLWKQLESKQSKRSLRKRCLQLLVFSCCVVALLGIALGVQAFDTESPPAFTFPSDPITFQSGSGSQIATMYCMICHSAEYIYMQPPHSREQWEEIVHKMKSAFGCPIPEADIPTLLTYLVNQNTIQPRTKAQMVKENTNALRAQSANSSSGNPSRGKKVFVTYCVNCHGRSGRGDGPIGKSLVPPAANLTRLAKKSDKEILGTIRKGRPGTAMPSWKNDLSSQETLDVLAYIRTLAP